jgi:hypothetical protein
MDRNSLKILGVLGSRCVFMHLWLLFFLYVSKGKLLNDISVAVLIKDYKSRPQKSRCTASAFFTAWAAGFAYTLNQKSWGADLIKSRL